MWRFVPVLSACLLACGDNRAGSPDHGPDAGPWQTAPHVPLPIVLPHTSTVLGAMQLVTLTYPGYDATGVVAFSDAMVASEWYRAVGAEYKLVAAASVQHKVLPALPVPVTRDAIAAQVLDLLGHSSDAVKPSVENNQVMYLVYVPSGARRDPTLSGVRGYHDMLTGTGIQPQGAVRFPIAVVFDDGSLASTTLQAAHQVINAAANPYLKPNDGWYADPPDTDPWCRLRHRDIADLCEGEAAYLDTTTGTVYPRVYSNAAARAGNPPCTPPLPGDVWSDVTAEPSQIQFLSVGPGGGEIRFKLTGWSTSPLPDWKLHVRAAETSNLSIEDMDPHFAPSDMINNSVVVQLTLRAPPDSIGATGAVEVLSGANQHPWAIAFVIKP
jgi:hypothetical protein